MEIELLEVNLVVYLCIDLPDHFRGEKEKYKKYSEKVWKGEKDPESFAGF